MEEIYPQVLANNWLQERFTIIISRPEKVKYITITECEYSLLYFNWWWFYIGWLILYKCLILFVIHLFFRNLALAYATPQAQMGIEHPVCDTTGDDAFYKNGGITNGAKWYSVAGGMTNLYVKRCFF